MKFLELAKQRCSVREYESKKVEPEKLASILEAGRVAPTATNAQPQKILVIQSDEGLEKLKKVTNFHQAPLAIVVCGDRSRVWARSYDGKTSIDIDGAIVSDHIVLEAEDLGLGSCWIVSFKPDILRAEFNLPENLEPVAIISIGYAKRKTSPQRHVKTRKPIEDMVVFETF